MIVGDVMDQIGARLETIEDLRVLPYEADSIEVPCALVSLPTNGNYLGAYQNGMTTISLIVTVLVSMANDRIRRDEITPYADDTGARSVKTVLNTGGYTACDVATVETYMFMTVEIEKIEYLAVVFTVTVEGKGR